MTLHNSLSRHRYHLLTVTHTDRLSSGGLCQSAGWVTGAIESWRCEICWRLTGVKNLLNSNIQKIMWQINQKFVIKSWKSTAEMVLSVLKTYLIRYLVLGQNYGWGVNACITARRSLVRFQDQMWFSVWSLNVQVCCIESTIYTMIIINPCICALGALRWLCC